MTFGGPFEGMRTSLEMRKILKKMKQTKTGIGTSVILEQESLLDRITTNEPGLRKHILFSSLQELPYDLFNGDDRIFAYFSVKDDIGKKNIILMPNSGDYKITDINLSCTEHFDEFIGQSFFTLNLEGYERVRIYTERPALEYVFFGRMSA